MDDFKVFATAGQAYAKAAKRLSAFEVNSDQLGGFPAALMNELDGFNKGQPTLEQAVRQVRILTLIVVGLAEMLTVKPKPKK